MHIYTGLQVSNDICCLSMNKNIFMNDFTQYKYQIYSNSDCRPNTNIKYIRCLQQDRIRNIFFLSKLAKYEYRIYFRCSQQYKYQIYSFLGKGSKNKKKIMEFSVKMGRWGQQRTDFPLFIYLFFC